MSDRREDAGRSLLLTAISYPLLVIGLIFLLVGPELAGATMTACGTFLIGVNEVCHRLGR